jgi:hypothetical protein
MAIGDVDGRLAKLAACQLSSINSATIFSSPDYIFSKVIFNVDRIIFSARTKARSNINHLIGIGLLADKN